MPSSILTGHTKSCGKCKKQITEIKVNEVYGNWTVLNIDKNNSNDKYRVLCKCSCMRTTQYNYAADLLNSKTTQCKKCSDEKTGVKNRLSHEEYIKRLKELGNIVKVKKGHKYIKNNKKLLHICSLCGEDWNVVPSAVLSGQTMCFKCSNSRNESVMANVLKQTLKHYFPDTVWEFDLGFRGENGGTSQYDICIPELNLIIECQSVYHDTPQQKKLDKKKKLFALTKGYSYMEIDHRHFTILQAIQIFFPHLNEVPTFVNLSNNTTRTWSLKRAQELLNRGLSYQEIAQEVGASYSAINHHICEGKLIKPKGYITKKTRLWDVKKAQSLLNEKKYTYNEIAAILGNNCTNKAIESAVKDKVLIRPKYRVKKHVPKMRIPIIQLSLDGKEVIRHDGITLVNGFDSGHISKACKGRYCSSGHKFKGYMWFYETDYAQMNA